MSVRILCGHVLDKLAELSAESVHCIWTSVPYWGLRAYGTEPQVWGGDPACLHSWGVQQRNGKRGDLLPSSETTSTGRIGVDERQATEILNGGTFCSSCGAWRGEHGLEPTLQMWLDNEVTIWRALRRVLRKDGVAWLNVGDAYATAPNGRLAAANKAVGNDDRTFRDKPIDTTGPIYDPGAKGGGYRGSNKGNSGSHPSGRIVAGGVLKSKDRIMLPARLAITLQDDGWWLRDEIVWHKPNPMPSSVSDRTTPAHEMLYLLTRSARYFYDAEAIKEPASQNNGYKMPYNWDTGAGAHGSFHREGREKGKPRTAGNKAHKYVEAYEASDGVEHRTKAGLMAVADTPWLSRNKRSVWTIGTEPFSEAHFATAPTALVEPCILAGTSEKGCCPACGAPWRRVIAATGATNDRDRSSKGIDWIEGVTQGGNESGIRSLSGATYQPQRAPTGAWEPSCKCPTDDPVPCNVLDPFGGSGTTGLVADRLGRNAILIELNPDYAAMAQRRLNADGGLFMDCAIEAAE